ncbi:MAG TPA: transposase, partial [Flavobacteriaceae bacterium]|nr:transposase [Flavobacteriaceae bacterium]
SLMSRNYKFHNLVGLYFVSFAVVEWLDVFTRQTYFDVLVQSVDYCRAHKSLEVYAYCFMPSHVHFIFRSGNEDPSGILRDIKKLTAKKTIEAVENNPQESRKGWFPRWCAIASRSPAGINSRLFVLLAL